LSTPSFAEASQVLENLLIEHISRPSQQLKKRKGTHKILKPVIRRSSLTGGVVGAAKDIDSRIQTTLETIESNIPVAIESIEKDIAISNRDKVILALANFLGMVFGVLKATAGSTNWEDVSTGNKIQVFAQILYGYGYWGPFALEYEKSRVDCGLYDLKSVLDEYGYVVHYEPSNLDATIASYFISELNGAMKEKLYCITSRTSANQDANTVETYIDVYTQLLNERVESL